MKKTMTLLLGMAFAVASFAQGTISGKLIDDQTGEPLIAANIGIEGTNSGTYTDLDGSFKLTTDKKPPFNLIVDYIGYKDLIIQVTSYDQDLSRISMENDAIGLNEVMVVADIAIARKTPVAVSTIPSAQIEAKLGNQEFVEIMKMTPSIYTTKTSGGFGDSRINVRGFRQEDVALLLNGIPVNGMEDNKIYWSNWAGLGDVTRTIQVQRGLGASKLAVASVGGTINILTKTTDQAKGGSVQAGIGNDGYQKMGMTLSTGRTDDGFALTFSGSRTTGEGYIEGNYIDAWSYFFSAAKEIGDNHLLMLTGVGAPQRHGQRSFAHNIGDLRNTYGKRWNDDYGTYQGEGFGWRENFYHKPQIGLTHIWDVNETTDLVTSAYVSIGRGGGTGDIGSRREFQIRNDVYGRENFDAIAAWNRGESSLGSVDPVAGISYVRNGEAGFGQVASKENGGTIKRASMNEHQWYGVLSNMTKELSESLTLNAGVDVRFYTGSHYRKAVDLLGAELWFDDDNINNMGDEITYNNSDTTTRTESGVLINAPNDASRLWGTVDDDQKIDYHNDENINWYGAFAQLEYAVGDITTFLSGAVNTTQMRRIDFFQKTPEENTTDWSNFLGGNIKAGMNYNVNDRNNFFVNAGVISRAPYFDALYPTFNNDEANIDAVNEKIYAFEGGYGYRGPGLTVNINGYYTIWQDKTEVRSVGENLFLNLVGTDAAHIGVELDVKARLTSSVNLLGMASIGDWQWSNNPNGVVTDDNQQVISETTYYIDGLKVGDAAQTTLGLGLDINLLDNLTFDAQYVYFENLFASYDVDDRADEDGIELEGVQALKLPSYGLVDAGMTFKFDLNGMKASARLNMNNVFNEEYVSEAFDNVGMEDADISDNRDSQEYLDKLNSTRGWIGFGRTWNATVKLRF